VWVFGVVCFTILSKNRMLTMTCVICFVFIGPVLLASGKGGHAMRVMLTAFDSEDPSLQVRYNSQKEIRALLLPAPLGYGIGRNANDITSIQPDSEYVRMAIGVGYTGLVLWLIFQYMTIHSGVSSLYFREEEDLFILKKAILAVTLMMIVAQFPQSIMAYPLIRLLAVICWAVMSLKGKEPAAKLS